MYNILNIMLAIYENFFRYLLVEILLTDDNVVNNNISDTDVYHVICDKVALLHGDYGIATIKTSFQVFIHFLCFYLKLYGSLTKIA